MSDASDSLLPTAPILPEPLGLDASAIDANLRAIRQVEATWRLPPLPDEVRLDFAGNSGLAPHQLSSWLFGLDADFHNENDGDIAQDPLSPVAPKPALQVRTAIGEFQPLQQTGFEEASNAIAQLRGHKPSETLDANATQRWKLKAIERGWLDAPENGIVDGSWSPELSSLQRQMQYAEYDETQRGNRFGARPLTGDHGVLKMLSDWTSPSGLFRQAVNLDLWWDTGQISKEFSSWGDKWRKVGDSHGVLDFAGNLFDALTGPIDDIVVPALNMALLFAGAGAAMNFGKLALTGIEGAESVAALDAASNLYKVPLVGRIFPAAQTAEALAEPSWLAQRLLKGGDVAQSVGGAMKAWRELPAVIGSKGIIQTGMRLGLVSQVEQRFLPNFKGHNLGEVAPVKRAANAAFGPGLITGIGEVLLAPYTIFEPGTFANGGRQAVGAAFKLLGTAPGRALAGGVIGAGIGAAEGDTGEVLKGAAIGAAAGAALPYAGKVLTHAPGETQFSKMVQGVGKALNALDYAPLADDQRMTSVFLDAMRQKLPPEEFTAFQGKVSGQGFKSAFAEHLGVDEQAVGAPMAFVAISASIDHTAALQAGNPLSKGFRERYFLARNKLTAQLRVLGDDTTREEAIWLAVSKESKGRRGLRARFDDALRLSKEADPDDSRLAELIAAHNEQASLTMRQLLSPDNLPLNGLDSVSLGNLGGVVGQGADNKLRLQKLTEYVAKSLDTFGNWGKYSEVTTGLRSHIADGLLADARLAAPMSIFNRRLSMIDHLDEAATGIDDSMLANFSKHLHDTLFLDPKVSAEEWRRAGGYYSPFARELDGSRSRFTVARAETASKQEYIEEADRLNQTLYMLDSWHRVAKLRAADGVTPIVNDLQLGKMSTHQVTQTIKALGMEAGSKDAVALRRLNRIVVAQGVTVDQQFDRTLKDLVDELASDSRWTERFGQNVRLQSKDGKVLTGFDLLKARSQKLLADARFKAAVVDHKDLIESVRIAQGEAKARDLEQFFTHVENSGYKLVYGADFLMPDELLHTTGLFEDITGRHMNAMTLGNFFGKRPPAELALNVQRARQRAIARELSAAKGLTGEAVLRPDSALVRQATADLYARVLDPALAGNAAVTDDLHHMNWLRKRTTAIREADTPRSIQDLGLGKNQSNVIAKMVDAGWSDQEAFAIWSGLKKGRYAEFKDLGLYALEAKLRGRSQLIDALRVLGGTPEAGILRKVVPGAAIGALVGSQAGGGGAGNAALGGAIGGVAGLAIGTGAEKAVKGLESVDHKKWARYGYLADNLVTLRDKMRFAMSPFFDVSRFTEAFMLSNTGAPKYLEDGTKIALPLNQSPSALRKSLEKGLLRSGERSAAEASNEAQRSFERITNEFRRASKGQFDPEELESTSKWFTELGIMGYNPTAWMASTFHHLREAGMDSEAAFHHVKDMYTYGTMGRSAAEQSVNFVVFPFSFQKKAVQHAAKWLSDDMTRSVLLHDAYKAYQLLDERYDLNAWAKDHLPVLEKLEQLNLWAFGLSPGRLGGINAPFIDAVVGNPLSNNPKDRGLIFNLFNPVGLKIEGPDSMDVVQNTFKRLVPLLNDLTHMLQDMKEQGHVLFDPSHMTSAAETREGYKAWGDYKSGVDTALKNVGASFYEMYNNQTLAPLLNNYKQKKLELENRYPGWVQSKLRAQANRAELDVEKEHRVSTALYKPEEATVIDRLFFDMERQLGTLPGSVQDQFGPGLKQVLAQHGITDFADMSPTDFDRVRSVGVEAALSARAAGREADWIRVWNRFYAPTFGRITSEAS